MSRFTALSAQVTKLEDRLKFKPRPFYVIRTEPDGTLCPEERQKWNQAAADRRPVMLGPRKCDTIEEWLERYAPAE